MPGTTFRGYPYSLPGDPADVPNAIRDLAEAVDLDAQTVADSVEPREMFHIAGNTAVSVPTWAAFPFSVPLSFNIVDVNVGNALPPMGPLVDIAPQLPGFYWITASITFPADRSSLMDLMGISLQTATETLVSNAMHGAFPALDAARNLQVQTGAYFNGTTDYVRAYLRAQSGTLTAGSYTIRNRYLTMTRMTDS